MKKVLIILLSILLISGCELGSSKKEVKVNATYYPFEYAVSYLYKDMSSINSIYPSEANTEEYTLTKKQKEKYSNSDIFVYSGLTKEVDYAVDFLNSNSNLNIIDATRGLTYSKDISELWLNPSNYLMIARNIKNTLKDYEKNIYNVEKIESLYEELKIKISELDVEYTMMAKNASNNNLLIADDTLLFLSKYNINVHTLNTKNESYAKTINDTRKLISQGKIKYVFKIMDKAIDDDTKAFIEENKLEIIEIDPMYTLSEEERKNNDDFFSIMKKNIEKIKTELFR